MKKTGSFGRGCSAHIYNGTFAFGAGADTAESMRRIVKRMDTTAGTSRMKILTECVTTVRITQHMTVYTATTAAKKTDSSCSSAAGRHASRHDHGRHHN